MSKIQESVAHLAKVLGSKNEDYTAGAGEFFNFNQAADIAGITPLEVITAQIAIKLTRIQSLKGRSASNESLRDSFLDLAGYAVIGHALLTLYGSAETGVNKLYDWNPAE